MKKIMEESIFNQIKMTQKNKKTTVSALLLFCSDINYRTKFLTCKFYHIISLFLKNYQTHYFNYYDESISTRFTKTLQ
jgi:hypothetical protein